MRVGMTSHIRFGLAARAHTRLDVFELRGARVNTLYEGTMEAGEKDVSWNGRDGDGRPVAAGVYFYRLEAQGQFVATRRMIVLR
jgi:hypothetical protein